MSPLPFEETALPRIGEATTTTGTTTGKLLPSISELLQQHQYHQEQAEHPVSFISNHSANNNSNALTETLERLADAVLKHEEQRRQLQLMQAAIATKTSHVASPVQQDSENSSLDSKTTLKKPKKTTTSTSRSRNSSKSQASQQSKKPSLKKKALRKSPELEWAQLKARVLSLEEIRKLKLVFMEKQKTMNKMSGMKMTDISSHYIFQHGSKHDHSNFAKWLKNNRGRNGRGGTNLLLLLIWFRLSHGEDFEKTIRNDAAVPSATIVDAPGARPQQVVSDDSIPLMTVSMDSKA